MRWGLLIGVACGLFSPIGALAMNFSPSAADLVLMPGEQTTLAFSVENTSEIAHTYSVSVYGVSFDSETGEPMFGPLSQTHADWLRFDAYDFILEPTASRSLTLAITIPETAPADTLTFAPVVRESTDTRALTLATGVSSLLFVTVGNPETQAEISNFFVQPGVTAHLPVVVTAMIANNGQRVVQPYGIVRITDIFGNVVDSLDFNAAFRRVPSQVAREFSVQWGETRANDGVFQELWRELTAGVGLFTAELVAAPYPGAQPTLQATTRFVVFPWRIALMACVIGTVGWGVATRRGRRF